jgi:hypothetical protein
MTTRLLFALICVYTSACYDAPVESPNTTVTQQTSVRTDQTVRNKVDVLFMIDNSPSMDAMQTELKARFGDFFQVFEDLAAKGTYADLNIGVVTSDYGAGPVANGGCEASPGGQKGLLQSIGAGAATGCVGPVGNPFIHYAFAAGGNTSNLPNADSSIMNLITTFTCMGSVGSKGCGFEHQLESVYAALKNRVENAGFLRDDALLVIVFVTNEDDGSAPPTANLYSQAHSEYGYFDTYRQTNYAIACQQGGMLQLAPYASSGGPLAGCVPAPMSMELVYDTSRYIQYFTRPITQGGVKNDPEDNVILVGLTGVLQTGSTQTMPFEVILADPTTGNGASPNPTFSTCGAAAPPTCEVRLQHSCQNTVSPAFFGDPPIRLQQVITSAKLNQTTSICGNDLTKAPDFTGALQSLGKLISSQIGPGCISSPFPDPTMPDCSVADITPNMDGTTTVSPIPWCTTSNNATPCWQLVPHTTGANACTPTCVNAGDPAQQYGVTINRGSTSPPPGTTAQVACSTIAIVPRDSGDPNNPLGCAM